MRCVCYGVLIFALVVGAVGMVYAGSPCCPLNPECVCGQTCDNSYCQTQGATQVEYCCDIVGGCGSMANEECCGADCSL